MTTMAQVWCAVSKLHDLENSQILVTYAMLVLGVGVCMLMLALGRRIGLLILFRGGGVG